MSNNPYYADTEEWHAYESGLADVRVRIANGLTCDPDINEDHLHMICQAYAAGFRAAHAGIVPKHDVK
jgi:hypothetical protein